MQGSDEASRKTPDNDESSQPSSSYVYPVKSLLTGIKPAPPTKSRPSIPRRDSNQAGDIATLQDLLCSQLASTRKKSTGGLDKPPSHPTPSRSHSTLHSYHSRTAITGPSDASEDYPRKASDPFSPRMHPIDDRSSLLISFTEASLSPAPTQASTSGSASPPAPPGLDHSAPSDPPSDTSPPPPQSPGEKVLTTFGSKPLPDLTEHAVNEKRRASPTHSNNSHVSHISHSGIVHLPPLPSTSGSSRAGSRGSGSHPHSYNSSRYFPSTNSNNSSRMMQRVPETKEEDHKSEDGSSFSSPDQDSAGSNVQGESEPAGDYITTRYRHETDENGNHVVIGREGDIRRCEDEVRIS